MVSERNIWQISGGPASRSYADVFLRHGVGLIGPGDSGTWTPDRSDEDFADGQGSAGSFVRRFATELKIGDVVLLRTGLSRVRAVGLVASDYLYLNQFDDVNGWDLQHGTPRSVVRICRRITISAVLCSARTRLGLRAWRRTP